MSRWLKEPLIHFLLIGGLIFAVYDYLAGKGSAPDEIYITHGQQENLLNTFARTWQRPPTPGEAAAEGARQALQRLTLADPGSDVEQLGDPLPLPAVVDGMRESELARLLGSVFTEELQGLETGSWTGPVESGFGVHLVYIERREAGRVPVYAFGSLAAVWTIQRIAGFT